MTDDLNLDRLLDSVIENIIQSMYDDWVAEQLMIRARAGVQSYIRRTEVQRCCDWCRGLGGSYIYGEEPEDFYRRHDNCKCMISFVSSKGKFQDAWTKKFFDTQKEQRIQREEEIKQGIKIKAHFSPEEKEAYRLEQNAKARERRRKKRSENR